MSKDNSNFLSIKKFGRKSKMNFSAVIWFHILIRYCQWAIQSYMWIVLQAKESLMMESWALH